MSIEWTKLRKYSAVLATRRAGAGWDAVLACLAAAQHGVVARWQLIDLGMTRNEIAHRVKRGSLHRVEQGVYAVGSPLMHRLGYFMAAVLACGPGAVLSHRSAAAIRGILEDARAVVDVIAPHRRGRVVDGIRAHACVLHPDDIDEVDGIPCTSLARTIVDLAGEVPERMLTSAYRQSEKLEELDLRALRAAMSRVARPRGIRKLRRVIAEFNPDMLYAESDTEIRILQICDDFGLPRPQVNPLLEVEGHAYRPDLLWPRHLVIVEGDGAADHSSQRDRHLDLEREQRLRRAGYLVRRFTWHQVTYQPDLVATTIRRILADREPPPKPTRPRADLRATPGPGPESALRAAP